MGCVVCVGSVSGLWSEMLSGKMSSGKMSSGKMSQEGEEQRGGAGNCVAQGKRHEVGERIAKTLAK